MKTFATDLLEATLVDKFDAALRSVELENGTLLATVLASAIMVDLRCSGSEDGVETIDTLDEDAIKELGALLLFAIEGDDRPFTLPLGTVVRPVRTGFGRNRSGSLGDPDGQAGPVSDGDRPARAYGRNLELLREFISKWVQGRPWQCIGLPSPSNISDYGPVNLLAFRPFTTLAAWYCNGRSTARCGLLRRAMRGHQVPGLVDR